MDITRTKIRARVIATARFAFVTLMVAGAPRASAHHDPDEGQCEFDASGSPSGIHPAVCGELGALIPVPIDAIHAGVSWTHDSGPKIFMAMRPSEYSGFHLSFRDDHDNHDHLFGPFNEFVYGGTGFSTGTHGLDQSNTKGNTLRENFVCLDLTHEHALRASPHYSLIEPDPGDPGNFIELLTKSDFALTDAAYSNAGGSRGLHYNVFCSGNVALADGRVLFIGGHDKGGNNAIRKLNIFDPANESWAPRAVPAVKEEYLAIYDALSTNPDCQYDAEDGLAPIQCTPDAYPGFPSALDEDNTDPPDPSDMKYQRWYPSASLLPDKTVLIVAGTDRDTSLNPARVDCETEEDRSTYLRCSLVTAVTPEIYDPETDRTIALESARKHHNTYPRVYPVQTGKGRDDWKVAIIGEAHRDSLAKDADGNPMLGLPPLSVATQYDPYTYRGMTYLFDVQAAKADPTRDWAGENHYYFVDEAVNAHNYGAGAQIWQLDRHGHALSQKVVLFGGDCGGTRRAPPEIPQPPDECTGDLIEWIDFEDTLPQWQQSPARLYLPVNQNNTSVLPDGKVLISGGGRGRGPWTNSFHLQLYDPETDTIEVLIDRTIAGHDHSTAALLPDGTVALMGGNATDLHGEVGECDDPDGHCHLELGIPVMQIYKPPYLFNQDRSLAARPGIIDAPDKITYRQRFNIRISEDAGAIQSVALVAIGPVTHNWDWGKRYLNLWFKQDKKKLLVQAPANPGLAVPMYYMLFIVNDKGVPSEAALLHVDG